MTDHLRAILHFGPPKTATSALQAWCHANAAALADQGVRYATVDSAHDPKHQWLVPALRSGDFGRLADEIGRSRDAGARLLVLSCEGMAVHRMSVPAAHWQRFRDTMDQVESTLFLVRRDPESWLASLWKQHVINPVRPGARLQVVAPGDFARMGGVRAMMDLPALAQDLRQRSGAGAAVVADMPVMLDDFRALLGLSADAALRDLPRANEALPDALIRAYCALAENATDVPTLRLAFFGLAMRCMPGNNVMLANVARRFAALPVDRRQAAIAVLATAATGLDAPEDAALVRQVLEMA